MRSGPVDRDREERKKKGNLINLKKEIKRKKDEQSSFQRHIQSEYQKAVTAARHNMGESEKEVGPISDDQTVIEERVDYYPQNETNDDPFGDVSIQISALESPQFTTINRALPTESPVTTPATTATPSPASLKKKIPTFAKFKHLSKSSQVFQKRKDKRRADKRKPHDKTKKKNKQKKHS